MFFKKYLITRVSRTLGSGYSRWLLLFEHAFGRRALDLKNAPCLLAMSFGSNHVGKTGSAQTICDIVREGAKDKYYQHVNTMPPTVR